LIYVYFTDCCSFNPRTRTGCDIFPPPTKPPGHSFNPRTRTGCDRRTIPYRALVYQFQPTHPHGVRLEKGFFQYQVRCVSTHAPARGATHRLLPARYGRLVSTHAPARGATEKAQALSRVRLWVSTHAPARGATRLQICLRPRRPGFNPRTRTGCDLLHEILNPVQIEFQPTHPHGVRQTFTSSHHSTSSFNPRTRTGCDIGYFRREYPMLVSTHAPARGATLRSGSIADATRHVSTHAPARGATKTALGQGSGWNSFNPRTRTGCDLFLWRENTCSDGFQPTHPHGVRRARP